MSYPPPASYPPPDPPRPSDATPPDPQPFAPLYPPYPQQPGGPAYQPGVATPGYGPPPPQPGYPAYAPAPAGRPPGGGSTVLLWSLIAVFALLLCAGAGVAGTLAFRTGDDNAASGANTPAPAKPERAPTTAPAPPTDEPATSPAPGGGALITYEVTGDGPATITYLRGGADGTKRVPGATLPWRAQVRESKQSYLVSLLAIRSDSATGSLTCRVLVNGKEVSKRTAKGAFTTVACIELLLD